MKIFLLISVILVSLSGYSQNLLDIEFVKKNSNFKLSIVDKKNKVVNAITIDNVSLQALYSFSESEYFAQYSYIKSNNARDLLSPPRNNVEDIKIIKSDLTRLFKIMQIDNSTKDEVFKKINSNILITNKNKDGFLIEIESEIYDEFNIEYKHINFKTDMYSFWFRKIM